MADEPVRFEDGAAYERMMGTWSRLAGEIFLDWLALPKGLRWLDVGCGNGAFTGLIVERCGPSAAEGVDPSEGQLAFARTRPETRGATFKQAGAMSLPYPDKSFDVATMALVIFFVPEPAKGVAELARVIKPGGTVAAYAWDIPGGGFPWEPVIAELREFGHKWPGPPRPEASRIDVMQSLWTGAGLENVEVREIAVQKTYASLDEFFTDSLMIQGIGSVVKTMSAADVDMLKVRLRKRLAPDAQGRITTSALANAAKGRVPK